MRPKSALYHSIDALKDNYDIENEISCHSLIGKNIVTGERVYIYTSLELPEKMKYKQEKKCFPMILKLLDQTKSFYVTEAAEMSLSNLIEKKIVEWKSGGKEVHWNYTKKLICAIGIATGLRELHRQGFYYDLLSSESILLDESMYPKLGSLHHLGDESDDLIDDDVDSDLMYRPSRHEMYRAPEQLSGEAGRNEHIDVFFYGMILFYLFTGDYPFPKKLQSFEIARRIVDGVYMNTHLPDDMNEVLKDLIMACWNRNPEKRPSMKDVCNKLVDNLDKLVDSGTNTQELNEYVEMLKYLPASKYRRNTFGDDRFGTNQETGDDVLIYNLSINDNDSYKNVQTYRKVGPHPALLKLIGINKTAYITEPPGISLRDVKVNEMSYGKKLMCALGTAAGLVQLHKNGLYYPGFNPKCIYLDEHSRPRIGLPHCIYKQKNVYDMNKYPGAADVRFLAPEVLSHSWHETRSDVYAYGMTMYFLFTGKNPFRLMKHGMVQSIIDGARPQLPEELPESLRKLIEKCWHPRLAWRPSIEEVYNFFITNSHSLFELEEQEAKELAEYINMLTKLRNSNDGKDESARNSTLIAKIEEYNHIRGFDLYEKDGVKFAPEYFSVYKTDEGLFGQDVNAWASLSHPCVPKVIGFCLPTPKTNAFMLLREHIPGPTLSTVVCENPDWFDDTGKAIIASGIALAMCHVHSKKVIHQNLSLDTIIIDDNHRPHVHRFELTHDLDMESTLIDPKTLYAAPEMEEGSFDEKVDVYRFGVVLYQIITGEHPFTGKNKQNPESFLKKKAHKAITPDAQNLIGKCWSKKPSDRPSFQNISRMFRSYIYRYFPNVDLIPFTDFIQWANN